MPGTLAVVGGTVIDVIFRNARRLPAWPTNTEFTPRNLVLMKDPPLVTLGGNGANAAYVAAACGAQVTLHTPLAGDALGGLARAWLRAVGCHVVAQPAPATAINVTAANAQHRRATFFYPGSPLTWPKLRPLPAIALACGWPHPPAATLARAFQSLRRQSVQTALDPGPLLNRYWTKPALKSVLSETDLLLINTHELLTLMGSAHLDQALARLRRVFSGHLILKRGAQGALWAPPDAPAQSYPAPKVTARNTIGAGDTFNGAFLAARLTGATVPAAIRSATARAAQVVASSQGVLGARRS